MQKLESTHDEVKQVISSKRMYMNQEQRIEETRLDTTIGDLIEAVTQIALEAGKTEEEGYKLASLTIESILRRQTKSKKVFN